MRRAAAFAFFLGLAAAAWWWWPTPRPAASVGAVVPEVVAPPTAEEVPPPPTDELAAPSRDVSPDFSEGFCTEDGNPESLPLNTGLVDKVVQAANTPPGGTTLSAESRALLRAHLPLPHTEASRAEVKDFLASHPDDVWPRLLLAVLDLHLGHGEERLEELRRLRKALPDDAAVAGALAAETREAPDLDEAIDALATYLQFDAKPAASVARLRARLVVQRDIQRGYRQETRNGVTLLWPPETLTLAQADALLTAVDRGLDEAAAFTSTQRRARLTAVVYPSRSELLAVSCARAWAVALYDGVLRTVLLPDGGVDLKVLRHETLHAQLSPLAPLAPRWFHEGTAQAFAAEPLPRRAWQRMVDNRVWIPFTSLDGTFHAFAGNADAELAYAQSYAMVEWMREAGGPGAVAVALRVFQADGGSPAALARACREPEVTGEQLLASIARRLQGK